VLHQLVNERRPLVIVLRGRDVAAVLEDSPGSRRQRGRHETELDERLQANRQQEIEDLIDVEEGIQQLAVMRDEGPNVI
jgi:hypothetical protein